MHESETSEKFIEQVDNNFHPELHQSLWVLFSVSQEKTLRYLSCFWPIIRIWKQAPDSTFSHAYTFVIFQLWTWV